MAEDGYNHYEACIRCENKAEFHCSTCGERLCRGCKDVHVKSNTTSPHNIVAFIGRPEPETDLCAIHQDLKYIMCCDECQLPVCTSCVMDIHKGHVFVPINKMYENVVSQCQNEIDKIKTDLLPECYQTLEDFKIKATKSHEELSKIREKMAAKAEALKNLVDIVLNENYESLDELERTGMSEYHLQEEIMNKYIMYLQNLVNEYNKRIQANIKTDFIQYFHENRVHVDDIPKLAPLPVPTFEEAEITKDDISKSLGKIEKDESKTQMKLVRKKAKSEWAIAPSVIHRKSLAVADIASAIHISCQDSEKAWVSDHFGKLVLSDGCRKMKETGSDSYHTVTTSGDLLIIQKDSVTKIAAHRKVENFIRTGRWLPISLCSSWSNEEVLIAMSDDKKIKISRYNKYGREVGEISCFVKDNDVQKSPRYLAENINSDVCFADPWKPLRVIDKSGTSRFKYTGQPAGSSFSPQGLCTDVMGNILISDFSCNIHIISKDGKFLLFLPIKEEVMPSGLCIDNLNNLWVGNRHSNVIEVFQYLQKRLQ